MLHGIAHPRRRASCRDLARPTGPQRAQCHACFIHRLLVNRHTLTPDFSTHRICVIKPHNSQTEKGADSRVRGGLPPADFEIFTFCTNQKVPNRQPPRLPLAAWRTKQPFDASPGLLGYRPFNTLTYLGQKSHTSVQHTLSSVVL